MKNILIVLLVLLNIHLAYETSKYVNKYKDLKKEQLTTSAKVDSIENINPDIFYDSIMDTKGTIHVDTCHRYIVLATTDGSGKNEPDWYSVQLPDSGGYDSLNLSQLDSVFSRKFK